MNRMLHLFICAALLFGAAPAFAGPGDGPPDSAPYRLTALFPGGDVLRPGPRSEGYTWYFGFDLGPTYSSFSGGPLNFYTPITSPEIVEGTMESTVDGGNGLGFYVGLTADLPINDMVGIVVKGNFHNRYGSFDNEILIQNIFIPEKSVLPVDLVHDDVMFKDEVDWSFRYFGFDLLGRFQLSEQSWYVLAGPSFGILLGNTAEASQTILSPDDVFYRETDGTVNSMITNVNGDDEIEGFESFRVDLKFGAGTWIELTDKLFLTPEITLAYPLTTMVATTEPGADQSSALYNRATILGDAEFVGGPFPDPYDPAQYRQDVIESLDSNSDFNMITIFFTVGLRWQID